MISYESVKTYLLNQKKMFWFQFPQTLNSAFLDEVDLPRLQSHDFNPGSITKK